MPDWTPPLRDCAHLKARSRTAPQTRRGRRARRCQDGRHRAAPCEERDGIEELLADALGIAAARASETLAGRAAQLKAMMEAAAGELRSRARFSISRPPDSATRPSAPAP